MGYTTLHYNMPCLASSQSNFNYGLTHQIGPQPTTPNPTIGPVLQTHKYRRISWKWNRTKFKFTRPFSLSSHAPIPIPIYSFIIFFYFLFIILIINYQDIYLLTQESGSTSNAPLPQPSYVHTCQLILIIFSKTY